MIKAENLLAVAWVVASEGAIFIRRYKCRPKTREYTYYRPSVTVANTDKEFIEKFYEMVESLGPTPKLNRINDPIRKPLYTWVITGREDVKLFLQEILPYLPIKVAQAKAVIDFCETGDTHWYEITKTLNKKGKY